MAAIANLDPAVEWLLEADEPLIRYRTHVDVLDTPPDDERVASVRRQIPEGPTVRALLSSRSPSGAARSQGGRPDDDRRRSRNWKCTMIVAPP